MATIGEVIQGVVEYSGPNASQVMNVFYWQLGTADESDADVLTAVGNWANGSWGAAWDDLAATDWTLTNVEAKVMNLDGTVKRDLGNVIVNRAGTDAGDTSAVGVCGYLQANTVLPKTRGRKFVPGLPDTSIVDSLLTAAALADLVLLLDEYLDVFAVGGGGFITPGVIRRVAEAWEAFNDSGGVVDVPAYQRRRKPNVGS